MKLIKISGLLLAAICGIDSLLPADADTLTDDRRISQIQVQIKDSIDPNAQQPVNSNSAPVQPTIQPGINSTSIPVQSNTQININPANNTRIEIYDPLNSNPQNSAVVESPILDRKPLIGRIIPASSAIVVTVPNDVQLDAGGVTSITLVLSRAIFDKDGMEIAPINSLISARVIPDNGGIKIVADSLVLRGKHIRLQASTIAYRGETITTTSGISKADSFGNIGEVLLRPFGSDVSIVGRGFGTIVGLLSPERQTIVRIPLGTIFVLSLQAEITFN